MYWPRDPAFYWIWIALGFYFLLRLLDSYIQFAKTCHLMVSKHPNKQVRTTWLLLAILWLVAYLFVAAVILAAMYVCWSTSAMLK